LDARKRTACSVLKTNEKRGYRKTPRVSCAQRLIRRISIAGFSLQSVLLRSHNSDALSGLVPWRRSLGEKTTPLQAVRSTANYEFAVKPQMKKYRCPWCMSTRNHNILYFVSIWGTSPLNTAICLWKAQNSLAWRGFRRSKLLRSRGKFGLGWPTAALLQSLVPPRIRHKAQNRCT